MTGRTEGGKVVVSSATDAQPKPLHEMASAGLLAWGTALALGSPTAALAYVLGVSEASTGFVTLLLVVGLLGVLLLAVGVHLIARKIDDAHRRIVAAGPSPGAEPVAANLSEVHEAIRLGETIRAIKEYRQATGTTLAEAKQAVDRLTDGRSPR